MKYRGQIKNINGDTIEVNVITGNDESEITQLTLAGDSPIIISQTSSDGIFSPIKSRSCTIAIVSKSTFFDMYSGQSHGTKVIVNNLTEGSCIFYGYLTPCEYNQPYQYLDNIELEAVDAVSTLQDYKYKYINGKSSNVVSIASILKYCLNDIAGYQGIYIPVDGLRSKQESAPTEMEYISESAFIDMNCYEVLEEICRFYNVSLVPFGNDVYLVDYELIAKEQGETIKFKNITENYEVQLPISSSINMNSYCGDSQNIELDEVYNKVSVKVTTIEVDDDELLYDPLDDINSSTYYKTQIGGMDKTDGTHWEHVTRLFEFIAYDNKDGDWRTYCNVNSELTTSGYKLTDNFSRHEISNQNALTIFPYTQGYFFNHSVCGQTCLPSQQFGYESTKELPFTTDWDNVILFFPQAEWMNEYMKQNGGFTTEKNYSTAIEFWYDFYENHMGGSEPVLTYTGKNDIQFSPTESTKTNYLAFTGNLMFQHDGIFNNVVYHLWQADETNHYYGGDLFPIEERGSETYYAYKRVKEDADYNKGWNTLKIKLSIGNKYWNGQSWQSEECAAWIPYHKENVLSEDELFTFIDYVKPVTNHDYSYKIGKDAFVIPINVNDGLHGRLKLEIFMPIIPYILGIIGSNGSAINPKSPINSGTSITELSYDATPPVIFMKDLSLELISTDNDKEHWYMDFKDIDKDNDDIVYSNDINSQNVTEFDDMDLKINTYNGNVPISQSYIIEPTEMEDELVLKSKYYDGGFYRKFTNTTVRQEMNIVNRLVEHYSNPKKIYNCQVHGYYEPWKSVNVNALNNLRMVVDSQEFDIKANTNELKLIEY